MRLGIIFLLLSLVIGGFAAWQTKTKLDSVDNQKSACFLRLQNGMAKGETLGAERARGAFTRECFVPDARLSEIAIGDSQLEREWVAGQTASVDIDAGVLLLRQFFNRSQLSAFDATKIPEGYRAVTIEVNESSSVGQFINPNSLVDVIGVFDVMTEQRIGEDVFPIQETSSATILQAVTVLAAGRVTSEGGAQGLYDRGLSYRSVTLKVTPAQAEILVMANAKSKNGLILSLRKKDDSSAAPINSIDFNSLIKP